ncbi:MAG: TetR/AcrR family transcriptional regulator [Caulobacteraceae bacterium]|nr:TetR/AcrR family transcriptional regulator [Caulobacteraceae bacterium]
MSVAAVKTERRSQAERREEAETRLLQAAIALVAERGLERVTLADVGEAAGYSRGLPAHYFGSKAGLIVTLAQRLVGGFGQALERVERHPPGLERLTGIVRFYLDSARKDPVGAKALLVLLGDGLNNDLVREPLAALNARSVKAFETNLAAAIEKGEARADIDVRAQAILILATLRGAVSQWQLAPGRIDLARVRDEMVASLKRSLAA